MSTDTAAILEEIDQDTIDDTLRFWKATRIEGASTSMAASLYESFPLIKAFDEVRESLQSRWISVDESLPELDADVLVHDKNLGVLSGRRTANGWLQYREDLEEVTDWQPLPTPPIAEGE